ncbi:MAG: S-methyl-5-thioribose-1-phosphate isomerase [Myxococcota bacterium]
MQVGGRHYRSIWRLGRDEPLRIIDQTLLPHRFEIATLLDLDSAAVAIETMQVRGAPLIGATAAHGLALALERDASDGALAAAADRLRATRPTAVNLAWAIDRIADRVRAVASSERAAVALEEATRIADEDVASCESIGTSGRSLIEGIADERARRGSPPTPEAPIEILTHCNAGWLATVDWGTALSPIYKAHQAGMPVHVWVDETRPRNQGASLTAFELREMGIPHTVVVDNAGGHLMQRGRVDAVFVGSDRTTARGDVCNKIGTYLKALAARDNGVPFYVALPTSTIDWSLDDGLASIPIEERPSDEVRSMTGLTDAGEIARIELFASESPAGNPAFDVTPSRFVTALVTERGVFEASREGLSAIAPAPRE